MFKRVLRETLWLESHTQVAQCCNYWSNTLEPIHCVLAVTSAEGTNTDPALASHGAGDSLGRNHALHCCGFYEVTLEHQGVMTVWMAAFPLNSQVLLLLCLETALPVCILKQLLFFVKCAPGRISVQWMLTFGNRIARVFVGRVLSL